MVQPQDTESELTGRGQIHTEDLGRRPLADTLKAFRRAQQRFQELIESGVQLEEPFHTGMHLSDGEFSHWQTVSPTTDHLIWLYQNEVVILGRLDSPVHLAARAAFVMLRRGINRLTTEPLEEDSVREFTSRFRTPSGFYKYSLGACHMCWELTSEKLPNIALHAFESWAGMSFVQTVGSGLLEGIPGCNLFLGLVPSPSNFKVVAMWRNPSDPSAATIVRTAELGDGVLRIPLAVIFESDVTKLPEQLQARATWDVELNLETMHFVYNQYREWHAEENLD